MRRALIAVNHLAGIEMRESQPECNPPFSTQVPASLDTPEVEKLRKLVTNRLPRSIVDVGAYDGISQSNSRPFVLDGWRAVLLEPHPRQFAKLMTLYQENGDVVCIRKACADIHGTVPLYLGSDGDDTMMSTLCLDDNPWMHFARSDLAIEVTVDRLEHILDELAFPAEFGILLVDAEAMDYEVLIGTNLARYAPRLILTEEYVSNPEKHRLKYRLLLDNGYTFYEMIGHNTLWIRNEYVAECLGL